jgi:signal transduction histidine kinase
MTNLIENAIKYGNENGRVLIEFEDEKKQVRVSVQDDGPGIPPEHLSRILSGSIGSRKAGLKTGVARAWFGYCEAHPECP